MAHGETRESYNSRKSVIYVPQSITRVQVLVTIERNGYVTQVLPEAVFTHE